MRLIDADELYRKFCGFEDSISESDMDKIAAIISSMHTVYDTDKVIEQLEESKHNALIMSGYEKAHDDVGERLKAEGEANAYKYAIEIVKGVGVDGINKNTFQQQSQMDVGQ